MSAVRALVGRACRKTWHDLVDGALVQSTQAVAGAEADRHVQDLGGQGKQETNNTKAAETCADMMNALWGNGACSNRMTGSAGWVELHAEVQALRQLGMPKGRLFSAAGSKKDAIHKTDLTMPNVKVRRVQMDNVRPLHAATSTSFWTTCHRPGLH